MEYWFSRICQNYVVANSSTGDIEVNERGYIREFTTVDELYQDYPDAAFTTRMGG